ncbi:hypothetical protein STRNTR1_1100 [Stenotrophomonas maltophilia]|nr:hypothetical protein STRNTR1_1100 [Stenotrophomonas maltophilia]
MESRTAHAAILRGHSQPWTPFRVYPLRHGDAGARLARRHVNAPHRGPGACRLRLANVRVQMATARSQRDPHDHPHHTPAAHQPARPDRAACRLRRQGAAPTARAAGTLTAHRRGRARPAGAVRVRNHGAQFCQLPHICGGAGSAARFLIARCCFSARPAHSFTRRTSAMVRRHLAAAGKPRRLPDRTVAIWPASARLAPR